MLNSINPFKKAASRITACCLFVLMALFSFVSVADAATVLQKSGSQFGATTVSNGLVKTNLSGSVKYIRHAKYGNAEMTVQLAHKQMTAGGGNFKAFAYSCPGYYLTRIYSDSKGTNLIGTIKIYVKKGEVGNSKCDDIQESSGTPTPPTSKINITHPLPHKQEPENMVPPTNVPSGGIKGTEKDPSTGGKPILTPPTPTLDERYAACDAKNSGSKKQYYFIKNPTTDKFECVDREGQCYIGSNLWYCSGCLEIYDYEGGTNPCEGGGGNSSPTGRDNYTVDQCSDSGEDECALLFEVLNSDDSPCLSCVYEMGLDEGGEVDPRRGRESYRAYGSTTRRS